MTATITATGVRISHAGRTLEMRSMPVEQRTRVKAILDATLPHVTLYGHAPGVWIVRRQMAESFMDRAIRDAGGRLDVLA